MNEWLILRRTFVINRSINKNVVLQFFNIMCHNNVIPFLLCKLNCMYNWHFPNFPFLVTLPYCLTPSALANHPGFKTQLKNISSETVSFPTSLNCMFHSNCDRPASLPDVRQGALIIIISLVYYLQHYTAFLLSVCVQCDIKGSCLYVSAQYIFLFFFFYYLLNCY